jgi:hypothetical protein
MPPVANAEAVGQIVYDFEPSVEARGQRASTERLEYDIQARPSAEKACSNP